MTPCEAMQVIEAKETRRLWELKQIARFIYPLARSWGAEFSLDEFFPAGEDIR